MIEEKKLNLSLKTSNVFLERDLFVSKKHARVTLHFKSSYFLGWDLS